MINYYQPFLLPFLGRQKHKLPENVHTLYYHSWEDAFWDLLRNKNIPQGSIILVPRFYCMDVLENIERHGFIWKMYEMDEHFQTNPLSLQNSIDNYQPSVIVIFHVAGISSKLLINTGWLDIVNPETLIIEDNVHRLPNLSRIKLFNNNHFMLDSLRKVSPLPGGFIYGTKKSLTFKQNRNNYLSFYFLTSLVLYGIFRLVFLIGVLLNNGDIVSLAHTKILKTYDNIIGNSWNSPAGIPGVPFIYSYFNFEKIEAHKEKQVYKYNTLFKDLYTKYPEKIYKINIEESDFGKLHVYPVGFKEKPNQKLIEHLHKNNIAVWFKFPDCPWSEDKRVLFLPLGFHISNKEQQKVEQIINTYLKK